MGPSKIKLKVQHKNHEKQAKKNKTDSIEKQKSQKKEQKSGAQLGKSKSKDKQQKKSVVQQPEDQDPILQKSKSKDKKESKLKEKSSDKKESKQDKKGDKKDKAKQKDKNKNGKDDKKQGKDKKDKKNKDKQQKQDKKKKKDKDKKKGKKGKNDSDQQDQKAMAKSKSKRGLDKELETINNINKQTTKAKLTIGELIEQYKDASYDIFINHGHNPQKQRQIQEQLQRLKRQKQKRHKKLQQLQKSAQQRKKQKQIEQQQKERRKRQKIIQKRKKNISLRLQNLAQQAKKRKQEHEKFQQYLTQRKRQQPRYKKYEQQFKQFQESLKQQQQEILQQRKLKVAPIDYQELQKFKQSYQQQKIQAMQHAQKKIELQQQIIQQQNEWLKNLYKGDAYKNMEQENKKNILIQEYQTAKQKLQKTKQYAKMIQNQFADKYDKDEEDDDQSKKINYDSEEVRYREKHKLGKSLGLVPEKRVKPLTHDQKVKMGVSYLEHLRKMPRKGVNSTIDKSNSKTIQTPLKSQRIGKTYILKRPTNPFYNLQRNGASFDAKNPRQIELTIEQVKSKDFSTALQEKSLHYVQYAGVTEMQKKHSEVNRRLVGDISQKLDILKKLVD